MRDKEITVRGRARTAMACLAAVGAWLAFQGPASAAPGQLTYDRCFANDDGVAGCEALAGAPIASASGVAVSPDGSSVYVASYGSNSVAHFVRSGPGGELAFEGCLANNGPEVGCLDLPYDSLGSARDVAISPDGKSVYVASAYTTDAWAARPHTAAATCRAHRWRAPRA
jgi:hypothetical protein